MESAQPTLQTPFARANFLGQNLYVKFVANMKKEEHAHSMPKYCRQLRNSIQINTHDIKLVSLICSSNEAN